MQRPCANIAADAEQNVQRAVRRVDVERHRAGREPLDQRANLFDTVEKRVVEQIERDQLFEVVFIEQIVLRDCLGLPSRRNRQG